MRRLVVTIKMFDYYCSVEVFDGDVMIDSDNSNTFDGLSTAIERLSNQYKVEEIVFHANKNYASGLLPKLKFNKQPKIKFV